LKRNIRIAYVGAKRTIHIQFCFQQIPDLVETLYTDIINLVTRLNFCSGIPAIYRIKPLSGRSENKLDFHFNASLTAVSLSKADSIFEEPLTEEVFSMCDIKTINFNQLFLERFIAISEIDQ